MRHAILLLLAATCLLAFAAPASADISFGIDTNNDGRCDGFLESFSIPAPIHQHEPCFLLAP